MIYVRKFHYQLSTLQLHKLPPNSTASTCWNSSTPYQSAQSSSSFWRPFSLSAQFHKESSSSDSVAKKKSKKPLGVFFQEAVGLLEKSEQSGSEDESENKELKCKLSEIEEEVRILREKRRTEKDNKKEEARRGVRNEGTRKKLHELFLNEEVKSVKSRKSTPLSMEDHTVYRELSPDMVMFVQRLYNEGYFKDSNIFPRKRFDITCFENRYARDFVKYAAQQLAETTKRLPIMENRKTEKDNSKEELEMEMGVLENEGKTKKLHELFVNEEVKSVKSRQLVPLSMEDYTVYKELSPDMVMFAQHLYDEGEKPTPLTMEDHTMYKELSPDIMMFVSHLYNEGYFKNSNFLLRKRFDSTCFENSYPCDFVEYAAEQFGEIDRRLPRINFSYIHRFS
ncbi:hypothetical protein HAX54_006969 [Datura stramonium]|uniref:Uncharacterized protein n=1 Tax=Datura stramonium TaxID=4076 RepID=A0ABS8TB07_DATST|nr:hypothetical protein [Datura stramonium]